MHGRLFSVPRFRFEDPGCGFSLQDVWSGVLRFDGWIRDSLVGYC